MALELVETQTHVPKASYAPEAKPSVTKLYTVAQVAKELGCSRQTVYHMIEDHEIEVCDTRGGLRIREAELIRYIASTRRKPKRRGAA